MGARRQQRTLPGKSHAHDTKQGAHYGPPNPGPCSPNTVGCLQACCNEASAQQCSEPQNAAGTHNQALVANATAATPAQQHATGSVSLTLQHKLAEGGLGRLTGCWLDGFRSPNPLHTAAVQLYAGCTVQAQGRARSVGMETRSTHDVTVARKQHANPVNQNIEVSQL